MGARHNHRAELASGRADLDAIRAAVTDRTRAVVLCNPNDPTGTYCTAESVATLAGSLPEHVHLLVDEAYIEFQDVEPRDSVLRLVDAFPRLLVFRTFSKIYGLSGLRAGYAVTTPALAARLRAVRPPWSANALALAALTAAAQRPDALAAAAQRAAAEREDLATRLAAVPGVRVWPAAANFCLIEVADGARVVTRLRERSIAVRPAGSFPGLDDRHIRLTAREPEANARLVGALAEAVAP